MYMDFTGRDKALKTLNSKWKEFRDDLACKKFDYKDLNRAKESDFLRAFDDALNYGQNKNILTKNLRYISVYSKLCRCAIIKEDEIKSISYSRFIPNQEKYPSINRFSPKGVDYLYLALRFGKNRIRKTTRFNFAEETSIKETRAQKGNTIALCNFNINESSFKKKIIDLTIVESKSNNELEYEFNEWFTNINNIHNEASIHLFKLYLKMISEEIFKPLKNVEKELEYAPFHCLAHYFKTLGFNGIIYKSTVYDKGRNIVLFNKYDAYGVGDIRIEKY